MIPHRNPFMGTHAAIEIAKQSVYPGPAMSREAAEEHLRVAYEALDTLKEARERFLQGQPANKRRAWANDYDSTHRSLSEAKWKLEDRVRNLERFLGAPTRQNSAGSVIDQAIEEKRPALAELIANRVRYVYKDLVARAGPKFRGIANSREYPVFVELVRPVLKKVYDVPPIVDYATATREEKDRWFAAERNPSYELDEPLLEKRAWEKAGLVLRELRMKLESKLVELDYAEARGLSGFDFEITGERGGHRVRIHQSMILNVSSKGKLYNQYPALIYVDGKKTSEKKYKEMLAALPKANPLRTHSPPAATIEELEETLRRELALYAAHSGTVRDRKLRGRRIAELNAQLARLERTRGNPWVHEMEDAAWPSWRVADGPNAGFEFAARNEAAALDYVRSRGLGSSVAPAITLRVLANPPEGDERFYLQGKPVWELNSHSYQAMRGVHAPWIAEISPMQYAGLSKREKKRYDEKRDREWQASADVKDEWRALVQEAIARGLVDPKTLEGEARDVYWSGVVAAKKQLESEQRVDAAVANRDMTSLAKGDVCFSIMSTQYIVVTKVSAQSVRGHSLNPAAWEVGRPDSKYQRGALEWLSNRDLEAAVKEGARTTSDFKALAQRKGGTPVRANPVYDVGFSWPSKEGRREIERVQQMPDGRTLYSIRTEGVRFSALLPLEQLDREIARDEANVAFHARQRAATQQAADVVAARDASLDAFLATMAPLAAGKAAKALRVQMGHGGLFAARFQHIERLVREGWRADGKKLMAPDGRFLTQADLTKAALDYARFLSDPPVRANRGRRKAVDEIVDRFKSRHWGHEADRIIDQPDPDLPDYLVQMGVLVHIELGSRRAADHVDIDFSKEWKGAEAGQAHLCFAVTKDERLYILLTPALEAQVRKDLLGPALRGGAKYRSLTEIADIAGGRQAKWSYPDVAAVPLGHVYRLLYFTNKIEGPGFEGQGGKAIFDHQLAEEGGYFPILAADAEGRLWICGGSYSVPAGGIKN